MNNDETKVYGRYACRAVFLRRPKDIVRAFFTQKGLQGFGELMRFCASEHKPYRVVPTEELEKISASRHHEGVCIVARPRCQRGLTHILSDQGHGLLLALDRVGNPHNLGSLLRTATHFAARAVLVGGALKQLSPAAHRTAQGGAEGVDVFFNDDLRPVLQECKRAGFRVCATSSRNGESLYETPLPNRCLILLGSESDGLSSELLRDSDVQVSIPGSGQVESLNVASSAAVFLAEHWRQHNL